MNKIKIILLPMAIILLFTVSACKITDKGSNLEIIRYVNQSGVEIAMVGEAYGDIPDSLVIPNGKLYECSLRYPGMLEGEANSNFPYNFGDPYDESKFIPLKVYYNKDICVSYTYKDKGKNPMMLENGSFTYEIKYSKNLITSIQVYTFTTQDYQIAIDAHKKE